MGRYDSSDDDMWAAVSAAGCHQTILSNSSTFHKSNDGVGRYDSCDEPCQPDLRDQQVPVFVVHSASKTQHDNYDSCDGDL